MPIRFHVPPGYLSLGTLRVSFNNTPWIHLTTRHLIDLSYQEHATCQADTPYKCPLVDATCQADTPYKCPLVGISHQWCKGAFTLQD